MWDWLNMKNSYYRWFWSVHGIVNNKKNTEHCQLYPLITSVWLISNSVDNLRVYPYVYRKLKLWSLGPSSLRSWSSASWRKRAVWRRGRKLRARSSSKSEPSTTAVWPRGRWGYAIRVQQKTHICGCKMWSPTSRNWLICRRRWAFWKLRWSSLGHRQLKTARGWLKTEQWLCSCYTRSAIHHQYSLNGLYRRHVFNS